MAWFDFMGPEMLAKLFGSGTGGAGSAAIPAGGGTPAGGAAYEAGVAPVHGGLSNAAGGAGNPTAYGSAPPVDAITLGDKDKIGDLLGRMAMAQGLGMMEEQPKPAMGGGSIHRGGGGMATFAPRAAAQNAGFYGRVMQLLGK